MAATGLTAITSAPPGDDEDERSVNRTGFPLIALKKE
jgi:hypothetical protein